MPPIPHPGARAVRFDDAVALDLSRRLDDLAAQLDAVARTDRDRIGACTAEWRGASRAWFDTANGDALARLARAATSARETAAQVRSRIQLATTIQLERNDEAKRADLADIARLEQLAARSGQP